MKQLLNMAVTLDGAADQVQAITQLSNHNEFTIDQAYEIQELSIGQRIRRGESLAGYKLGFTSKAKMEQMGIHEIIWGRLTNQMQVEGNGTLLLDQYIHPRAEPEVAFRISKTIDKKIELNEVYDYFDAVCGAIEIIDSRYKQFRFSLEDVIADNCSSSAYVLGDWFPADTELNHLDIQLKLNKKTVQSGNSSAILGNPLESLVALSEMAEKYNIQIIEGQIVLAGAATSAEYLTSGDRVEAIFQNLGSVNFKVN